MPRLRQAVARNPAYLGAMLICRDCGKHSTGKAWHWIALLRPAPGGSELAAYCPGCAEARFRYFSVHRARRAHLAGAEDE